MHQFFHRNKERDCIENTTITGKHFAVVNTFFIFPFVPDYMTILTNKRLLVFIFSTLPQMFTEGYWRPGDTKWPSGAWASHTCCGHWQETGKSSALSPPYQRTFCSTAKYLNCHAWLASDRGQEKRNGLF